jgi:hypothetical protein
MSELLRRAKKRGLEDSIRQQLNYVVHRMMTDPSIWGEPFRHLVVDNAPMYHAIYQDLLATALETKPAHVRYNRRYAATP